MGNTTSNTQFLYSEVEATHVYIHTKDDPTQVLELVYYDGGGSVASVYDASGQYLGTYGGWLHEINLNDLVAEFAE